jgi:hypothetical protein
VTVVKPVGGGDQPPEDADAPQLRAGSDGGHAEGSHAIPSAVRSYPESLSHDLDSIADAAAPKVNQESKSFGPSGPPKDLAIRRSIDLQRQTISRSELIDLLSLASKDNNYTRTFFHWADGSINAVWEEDPSEHLRDFHQMEALRSVSGSYSYPDGSKLSITLHRYQQELESRADTHNSDAERRMYELRTLASDWNGARLSTRSRGRRRIQNSAQILAVLLLSAAIYFFAISQGLPSPSEGSLGMAVAFGWTLITGIVAGAVSGVFATRRNKGRKFVMRHPERRQLSHDQIQSWATVIGVVVAVVFGVLTVVLKP